MQGLREPVGKDTACFLEPEPRTAKPSWPLLAALSHRPFLQVTGRAKPRMEFRISSMRCEMVRRIFAVRPS